MISGIHLTLTALLSSVGPSHRLLWRRLEDARQASLAPRLPLVDLATTAATLGIVGGGAARRRELKEASFLVLSSSPSTASTLSSALDPSIHASWDRSVWGTLDLCGSWKVSWRPWHGKPSGAHTYALCALADGSVVSGV